MLFFCFNRCLGLDTVNRLTAMRDENVSTLTLLVTCSSQFCHVCELFYFYTAKTSCSYIWLLFPSIFYGNGLIVQHMLFLHLLIHSSVFDFDSFSITVQFLSSPSWIYFSLQEKLSVLYSWVLSCLNMFVFTYMTPCLEKCSLVLLSFTSELFTFLHGLWHWILLWIEVWCQSFFFFFPFVGYLVFLA